MTGCRHQWSWPLKSSHAPSFCFRFRRGALKGALTRAANREIDFPSWAGVTPSYPAGQRVHLVGPSGAGKTTLMGLLMRMQDVAEGAI